ncbi:hypothetical protein [Bartonella heixiaziensis]|uniref:hypothetical protein n=1 Tax=Bartonella heixiaziensis TaxID=1461000 RepID=UPI003D1A2F73
MTIQKNMNASTLLSCECIIVKALGAVFVAVVPVMFFKGPHPRMGLQAHRFYDGNWVSRFVVWIH